MKRRNGIVSGLAASLMAIGVAGCGGGSGNGSGGSNGGGGSNGTGGTAGAVTFWQDVAPIYNNKCVACHQTGGLGPFPLDDYASAAAHADVELARTAAGTMPPYFMVHDDSCGSFEDQAALTSAEKATIAAWVGGGHPEGTRVTLTDPAKPVLANGVDVKTPTFAPVAQGGQLAENDEYRCFLVDPPNTANAFLTGYDVTPGEASIVHHVIAFVVDPAAMGSSGSQTNAAVMQALDAASPDRLGWPCFGDAGDGVRIGGVPVTWAPGQGVVEYPSGMGVPIASTSKLVVQIHYNLVDPASAGKTDSTTIHLQFATTVSRQLAFLLPDPFLDSLGKATPDTLPPGQADAKYTWSRTGAQIGLSGVTSADLVAVMPHMHGRGLRQTMTIGPSGAATCASHLESWDFHWQKFYFYKTTMKVNAASQFSVTCEYNTSADTAPVVPGWGTHNEMCLNVLMVAL